MSTVAAGNETAVGAVQLYVDGVAKTFAHTGGSLPEE